MLKRKDILIDNFIKKLENDIIKHPNMIYDLMFYENIMVDVNLKILEKYYNYSLDYVYPNSILLGVVENNLLEFIYVNFETNSLYCKTQSKNNFDKYKSEVINYIRLKKLKRLIC